MVVLPVRTRNANRALFIDDGREKVLAPDDLDATLARGIDLDVGPLDRRGDDDRVDAGKMSRVVPEAYIDSSASQERGRRGAFEVAAGDGHASTGQDLCNATHSDSADADEMNVLNLV